MQPENRVCAHCGGPFVIRFVRQARQRFCGNVCAGLSRPKRDQLTRFWQKVQGRGTDRCWLWTASAQESGYGSFYFDGQLDRAHRVSWKLAHGSIPDGAMVLHHCDNPRCVNPSHLFLGTNTDNMRDMIRKGRHAKKLTPMQAIAIRADERKHKEIAREYGVSRPLVSAIKRGDAWGCV